MAMSTSVLVTSIAALATFIAIWAMSFAALHGDVKFIDAMATPIALLVARITARALSNASLHMDVAKYILDAASAGMMDVASADDRHAASAVINIGSSTMDVVSCAMSIGSKLCNGRRQHCNDRCHAAMQ